MNLKTSTALRNDYPRVAALAKKSGKPIVITNKGGGRPCSDERRRL